MPFWRQRRPDVAARIDLSSVHVIGSARPVQSKLESLAIPDGSSFIRQGNEQSTGPKISSWPPIRDALSTLGKKAVGSMEN